MSKMIDLSGENVRIRKVTAILANELEVGDTFRLTRHPFSVEYTYDYENQGGIACHGVKPDGTMSYRTIGHYETVYKLEVEN